MTRARVQLQDCGWGADHGPHQHPGLDNARCPGLRSDPPADLAALDRTVKELNANIRVTVAPNQLGRRNWCTCCRELKNGIVGIEVGGNAGHGIYVDFGLCPPCLRDLMGKLDSADNRRMALEDAEGE